MYTTAPCVGPPALPDAVGRLLGEFDHLCSQHPQLEALDGQAERIGLGYRLHTDPWSELRRIVPSESLIVGLAGLGLTVLEAASRRPATPRRRGRRR